MTIQIILLTKLGKEQVARIQKFPNTCPCFLSREDPKELRESLIALENGAHITHLLIGLEQAAKPVVRQLLKRPDIAARIGLVVIDECYLVS